MYYLPDERHLYLLFQTHHDDGQREDQRLPGAGEGYTDHVTTAQNRWDALNLDGRWLLYALRLQTLENT